MLTLLDQPLQRGVGGGYILASYGVPYYAYLGGDYIQDAINTRFSVFAQDSWSVGPKLTINTGLRFDNYRGYLRALDDTVLNTKAWGPRVGFAYDLNGNGRTVLRGHYGRYYDGAKASYYDLLNGESPTFGVYIDPVTLAPISETYLISPGTSVATIDPDIKQPKLDQVIAGVDHELFNDFSVGANFIYRKNSDFIDDILINGEFEQLQEPDPGPDGEVGTADDPGTMLTVFNQLNDQSENRFLVTNPEDGFRRYRGLELTANKRFTNGWMLQASWVISKITGNINNNSSTGNSTEYDDPNLDPRFQPVRGQQAADVGIVLEGVDGDTHRRRRVQRLEHDIHRPAGLELADDVPQREPGGRKHRRHEHVRAQEAIGHHRVGLEVDR